MKKIKPLDLSSREEIGRDEMRNMTARASSGTSGSGSGSGFGSGSGSGSGSAYDRYKERELQKEACNGKTVDASCSWVSPKLGMQYGTCQGEYVTRSLYCVHTNSSGVGSGTGGFSAREEACINKKRGDHCSFIGDKGVPLHGTCGINSTYPYKVPLMCYTNNLKKQK